MKYNMRGWMMVMVMMTAIAEYSRQDKMSLSFSSSSPESRLPCASGDHGGYSIHCANVTELDEWYMG